MIIGIDHGYYAIKTKQVCFPTGIIRYEYEPYTMQNVLQYQRQLLPFDAGSTGTGDSKAKGGKDSESCSCSRASPYRVWKGKTEIQGVSVSEGTANPFLI